jgi:hypothetical protein
MSNPIRSDQLSQYWRGHIDACRDSGSSGAAYCQLHQLAYHRFNYWRRKFQTLDSQAQLTPCESTGFARVLASRSELLTSQLKRKPASAAFLRAWSGFV